MKKLVVMAIISMVGLVFWSAQVLSFGIPSVGNVSGTNTESVVKEVGKMVAVEELNKWLAGQNCICNDDGTVTGCDLSAIGKKVRNSQTAVELALGKSTSFYTKAKNYTCNAYVTDSVGSGYWSWQTLTYGDPKIKLWVK